MATKQELAMEKYAAQLKKVGVPVNKALLESVTKGMGPSQYKLDSMFVAASDKAELARVHKSFIMKKCGVKDEAKAKKALDHAVDKMSGVRKKYRGAFYYIIAKKLGVK
ncbi:MAG: DUF2853 family protein [Candidatus Pacebacteria bacterium]|nr:DUF2853 family protein [Candidatus Paceibacterota bacterium]